MRKNYLVLPVILTITIVCLGFSVIKNPKPGSIKIEPIGFSIDGFTHYCLLGGVGAYLEYREPDLNIQEPKNLPKLKDFTYSELLMSCIKSLLFEYKNYQGSEGLSAYSFFGLGNYRIINDELLAYANKKVLNNQTLLKSIYDWMLPYYQTTFNSITVEEQQVMFNNLNICEHYVGMVLEKKDQKGFDKWIKGKGFIMDEKTIGFLKRRISKKQWTIADCKKWIHQIKTDFTPLLKDPGNAMSHFQITDTINNDLFIAVNHKGEYGLVDAKYRVREPFRHVYIRKEKDGQCNAYYDFSNETFTVLREENMSR
jgi:hypothetical protein